MAARSRKPIKLTNGTPQAILLDNAMRKARIDSITELAERAKISHTILYRFANGKTSTFRTATRLRLYKVIPALFDPEPLSYEEFVEATRRFLSANPRPKLAPNRREAS